MIATMKELLPLALEAPRILCGFNVFGYEDAIAIVEAGEELGAPVLLMTNRAMTEFMPPEQSGPLFRTLANNASIPVGIHLDHAYDLKIVKRALESGFTSVMYDGSKTPLDENIKNTIRARKLAEQFGASLEGEVGTVPYSDLGEKDIDRTSVEEAERFAAETGVDALAISVGNIHRLANPDAHIDFDGIRAIESVVSAPLVIHGASGISDADVKRLLHTRVAKCNIGTRLRQAFASSIRAYLENNPDDFDHLRIMTATIPDVRNAAIAALDRNGWKSPKAGSATR